MHCGSRMKIELQWGTSIFIPERFENGLDRSRTDTPVRAQDFESSASANSATRPCFDRRVGDCSGAVAGLATARSEHYARGADNMIPLFLGLTAVNLICLTLATVLGFTRPGGTHVLSGALAALVCVGVHCV